MLQNVFCYLLDHVIFFVEFHIVTTVQKKTPVFGLDCKIIEYQTSFLFSVFTACPCTFNGHSCYHTEPINSSQNL